MVFPVAGPEIVGAEHAGKAVALLQPGEIGGGGEDIVARHERIGAQTVGRRHLTIGVGHQLHDALRPGAGGDGAVAGLHGAAAGFVAHHRAQPQRRDVEFLRRFPHHRIPAIQQGARTHRILDLIERGPVRDRHGKIVQVEGNRRRLQALLLQRAHGGEAQAESSQQGAVSSQGPGRHHRRGGQFILSSTNQFSLFAVAKSPSHICPCSTFGTASRRWREVQCPKGDRSPLRGPFPSRRFSSYEIVPVPSNRNALEPHGTWLSQRFAKKFRRPEESAGRRTADESAPCSRCGFPRCGHAVRACRGRRSR